MYWANLLHIYQPPGQKKEIIDQVIKESYNRILAILQSNPNIRLSLNICASLTEQLVEYGYQDFLEQIKHLAKKGQIELVGSAAYHPILPLLPRAEVSRQIKLNEDIHQKYFGKIWQPKGFFLPELAYNKKTALIIQDIGYKWIVLDEIAYSLCSPTANYESNTNLRIANKERFAGKIGMVKFDRPYIIKDLFPNQKKRGLKVIFRNRGLSLLFFGEWLDSIKKFFSAVKKDGRSDKFLITAFDGENLGHHRKHLVDLWAKILQNPKIQNITYSEYLDILKDEALIEVKPLSSSWSTEIKDLQKKIPYPLWQHPENQLHQYQWQLTNLFINFIKHTRDNSNYKEARKLLDKAFASDQYWWASAKPWWGPGMIKRGVERFLKISELLKDIMSTEEQNRIQEICQKIFKEIEQRSQLNN
ncbi:polysaccharide deacetylase family protein [Patescibacteria group bacterium]|nr:polysaccharide deacetylase family protein [Patescibacteria group bacterium]